MKTLSTGDESKMVKVMLANGLKMEAPRHGLGSFTIHQLLSKGEYERKMTDSLLERLEAGDVFVDVGAQYGYYTLTAATVAGQVYAFEPYAKKMKVLEANVERNGLENVELRNEALFSENGEAYLHNHTSRVQRSPKYAQCIRLARFDDLGIGRVDAVKVDVEGAEVDVLEGMRGTLGIWRPLVLVEVHKRMLGDFGHRCGDVERLLKELGYEVNRLVTMGDRYHVMGR